ncbi:hypothetical protein DL768_000205 [Monosporascus sp. mg162]|nr:hypothetical protein DL768_000205 [Monosporascus sp. mg162]
MRFCARLSLFSLVVSAVAGSESVVANLKMRSTGLQERQECRDPGWIPVCPDGTQPIATAGSSSPVPTITDAPSTSAQTVTEYIWFTTQFTWYYWYYYYTYISIEQTTVLTSSEAYSTTAVSVSATDSAQASILFSSFSATWSFPTPTQTATSLIGSATQTAVPTSTIAPTTTITTSSPGSSSSVSTNTSSTTTPVVTAAAMRVGPMIFENGFVAFVTGTIFLVPACLMILL